ncbi:hypothetical protein D3C84_691990 [compost metagenome]
MPGQHEMTIGIGQPQADRVAEVVPGKPQAQAFDAVANGRLDRHFAVAHAPGDGFRSRPEGRIQAAFAGQRIDHAALSGFRQQAQRPVEVGFATAVRPGDQVQTTQWNHQFIDRAVIGHREGFEHWKLPYCYECSKPVHLLNPVLSSQSYRHWHVRTTQRSLHGWSRIEKSGWPESSCPAGGLRGKTPGRKGSSAGVRASRQRRELRRVRDPHR